MEGGRFCFEGGTRCGKGEGLHVLRIDNSEELQVNFDFIFPHLTVLFVLLRLSFMFFSTLYS